MEKEKDELNPTQFDDKNIQLETNVDQAIKESDAVKSEKLRYKNAEDIYD